MTTQIAVVLYDGMTALDAIGPAELLRFLPDVSLHFVSPDGASAVTDTGLLHLGPAVPLADMKAPDVVVVPGGPGTGDALRGPIVPWLVEVHPHTRWVASVCSGSLLLGAAGLLRGLRATSHFAVREVLTSFGALPTDERVVVEPDARVMTAAGVSAGIDMAVRLIDRLAGPVTADAIRLITEYDPDPQRPGGSLATASPSVIERAVELGRPKGAIPPGWGSSERA